ncbi:Endoplasmic reticulum-Golgi intermediate compartment 3 [Micractinium conductrix]|uniref:Endoplasmic reticulum-Golgi intermediate compartment 3 n=1 Tax=Micractinium conductrix TaxID=554055 RepID=A0A2P6VCS1_9CHLO|nr:Endoplasmic reticulum-Golgi intermediate compartment 3 [Micractinium conductrix]|eukprot:PSC71879.1 Endoplasmic reticulum-Golgi intermediate compartment 3 [Micractinium conductrix]
MGHGEAGQLAAVLRKLDAFPKQREEAADFFQRTTAGGAITIVSAIFMTLLFFSELRLFTKVTTVNELSVDTSRGEMLEIHFDVTFPRMPCAWLSVDAMDISGEVQLEVDHDVYKRRLAADGTPLDDGIKHEVGPSQRPQPGNGSAAVGDPNYCGSCYGSQSREGQCCNTCAEVREAYRTKGWALLDVEKVEQCHHEGYKEEIQDQKGEGCHLWGELHINKVAGNFHFAPGRSYQQGNMHIHDLSPFAGQNFDFSHTIHKLAFGKEYPGMRNPLDGVKVRQELSQADNSGLYQYFLKVVPTSYANLRNNTIYSNQFSVTEHFREIASPTAGGGQLPGVFLFYDLSPIKVRFQESCVSFLSFLTSLCAIIGGVFTVSGIIDATVYHGQQAIQKKLDLGKLS